MSLSPGSLWHHLLYLKSRLCAFLWAESACHIPSNHLLHHLVDLPDRLPTKLWTLCMQRWCSSNGTASPGRSAKWDPYEALNVKWTETGKYCSVICMVLRWQLLHEKNILKHARGYFSKFLCLTFAVVLIARPPPPPFSKTPPFPWSWDCWLSFWAPSAIHLWHSSQDPEESLMPNLLLQAPQTYFCQIPSDRLHEIRSDLLSLKPCS